MSKWAVLLHKILSDFVACDYCLLVCLSDEAIIQPDQLIMSLVNSQGQDHGNKNLMVLFIRNSSFTAKHLFTVIDLFNASNDGVTIILLRIILTNFLQYNH